MSKLTNLSSSNQIHDPKDLHFACNPIDPPFDHFQSPKKRGKKGATSNGVSERDTVDRRRQHSICSVWVSCIKGSQGWIERDRESNRTDSRQNCAILRGDPTLLCHPFSYPITGVGRLRANADQAFDHVPNIWAKDPAEGFRGFKATCPPTRMCKFRFSS